MRFELKPLSFGEVIDGAFKILRQRLGVFIPLWLVFQLPIDWANAWMQMQAAQMVQRHPGNPVMNVAGFLLAEVVMMVGYLLLWGTANAAAVQAIAGEASGFGKACRRLLGILGPTVVATLIFGLATVFFTLLLIVPGIIYYMRRSLYLPVLLVEGGSGGAALARSKKLVTGGDGRTGRIFATTFLFTIIGLAFNWGFRMLLPASLTGTFVGSMIALLPQTLLTPVHAIAIVLIYYDARVRDEGYDLELRAQDAGAAPPTTVAAGPA